MLYLLKIKLLGIKNHIKYLSFSGQLKIVFGIFIGLLFLWILYLIFYRVLSYIQSLPMIGSVLMLKFLAISFLTTFIMVLFSSVIVSFSTVYFSRDLFMLFSFPISTQKLFISKTIDVMLQSSWMMVLTMIPFLIAFAQVKNVNIDFFIGVIFLIIPFLFISTVIGVIISLLILYLFPSSKVRDIILVLTIIIGSIGYVLLRFLEPEKLANPDVFFDTMEYLAYLNAPVAKILPSWWITDALNSI